MKIYLILFMASIIAGNSTICMAETKEKEVKISDLKIAEKVLKKIKIKKEEVTVNIERLSWQQECMNSAISGNDPLTLTFVAEAVSPIKVRGLDLDAGTLIEICDGRIVGLRSPKSDKTYSVAGFNCEHLIRYTKAGELCECKIGKDTIIGEVQIPRGSIVYPQGRGLIFWVSADSENQNYPRGLYEIKDGKAVKSRLDSFNCEY